MYLSVKVCLHVCQCECDLRVKFQLLHRTGTDSTRCELPVCRLFIIIMLVVVLSCFVYPVGYVHVYMWVKWRG